MSERLCVWVMEIAILSAKGDKISYWEVWSAHNTRSEAVAERDRQNADTVIGSKRFRKLTQRIRKYVPEHPALKDADGGTTRTEK